MPATEEGKPAVEEAAEEEAAPAPAPVPETEEEKVPMLHMGSIDEHDARSCRVRLSQCLTVSLCLIGPLCISAAAQLLCCQANPGWALLNSMLLSSAGDDPG